MSNDDFNSSAPLSRDGRALKGTPIRIIEANIENGQTYFDLNLDALENILLNERIRHTKVAVVSVAGAFRQGKSFLLDFFLRYLDAEGDRDWIGASDSPLEGFPWRPGSERYTTGIMMWSEPFLRKLPNGETIAILLMDTQGSFDSQSTVRDCATVFALSTLLSSIQVFNISSNIQEDHLQHLQLFTEYGRLALEKESSKPFQILQFLVRDWPYPYEFDYGPTGGEGLIAKRLKIDAHQPEELQQIRRHIWSCFQDIRCFLMPHPGFEVSQNPNFRGCIAQIEPRFVEQMQRFVPLLLNEENLHVKEINGNQLDGRALLEFFKCYITIYRSEEIPEPRSVLQATAEANNLAAQAVSRDMYERGMLEKCGGLQPYMNDTRLKQCHSELSNKALEHFDSVKKMGGEAFSVEYRDRLILDMSHMFKEFQSNNASKNYFGRIKTPATLSLLSLFIYVFWGFMSFFVSEGSLYYLCAIAFMFSISLLTIWFYAQYAGEYHEVIQATDVLVEWIHTKIIQPLISHFSKEVIANQVVSSTTGASNSRRNTTNAVKGCATDNDDNLNKYSRPFSSSLFNNTGER